MTILLSGELQSVWNTLILNYCRNLIFVVPCIMLNSEIIPTRCNNCVYSSQWLYSTCFGWQSLNTQHSEKQHGITRQCYLQLNTTDNDKTTRILTNLQHKYTCLPERPYTALYSWWWVELSPETCRVKPLRRINAIVASCWNYLTTIPDDGFTWAETCWSSFYNFNYFNDLRIYNLFALVGQ